jgi:hypothetical protein
VTCKLVFCIVMANDDSFDNFDFQDEVPSKPVKHPELLVCVHNALQFMEYHPNMWPKTADEFLKFLGNFSTTSFLLDPLKIVSFLHTAGLCKPSNTGLSFDKEKLAHYSYQQAQTDALATLELLHIKKKEDKQSDSTEDNDNSNQNDSDDTNESESDDDTHKTAEENKQNASRCYSKNKRKSSCKNWLKRDDVKKEERLQIRIAKYENVTANIHNANKNAEFDACDKDANSSHTKRAEKTVSKTTSADDQTSLYEKSESQTSDKIGTSNYSNSNSIEFQLTLLAFKRVVSWLKANIRDLDTISNNAETLFYTLTIISQIRVEIEPQAIFHEMIKRRFVKVKANGRMKYYIEPLELDLEADVKRMAWSKTFYTFILLMLLVSFMFRFESFQNLIFGRTNK